MLYPKIIKLEIDPNLNGIDIKEKIKIVLNFYGV